MAPDIEDTLTSLTDVINGMEDFDATSDLSTLDNAWNDLDDLVVETYRSTRLDFSSTSNKNILEKMADPT